MALSSAGRHILRIARLQSCSAAAVRSVHGFNDVEIKEMKEKFSAFPGGSIDLVKEDKSGIAVMTLNNPGRVNAFSGTMMLELEERVAELEGWTKGKGLIVKGAGQNFCSGNDLNKIKAMIDPQDGMKVCMFMQNALTRLNRLPLISVALVEGKALGGGAELTVACDFRLMAPGSVIQFMHKFIGLVPGWGGAARLVHIVGRQTALKLLASAKAVDPDYGMHIGLADGLVNSTDAAGALAEAGQWLARYTKVPAPVNRAVKQVVVSGSDLPLEDALKAEKDVFGTVWGAPANLAALYAKMYGQGHR
ncbi:ethylmalonyl-CoA decarboxylase-like [Engraulis encrasicolus]|uniref:ethylmalonyl-CoA decarboxylase-like n=1 Tax=Engraulis encrasicolus TaxID=184585 RepID=UPI002FD05716